MIKPEYNEQELQELRLGTEMALIDQRTAKVLEVYMIGQQLQNWAMNWILDARKFSPNIRTALLDAIDYGLVDQQGQPLEFSAAKVADRLQALAPFIAEAMHDTTRHHEQYAAIVQDVVTVLKNGAAERMGPPIEKYEETEHVDGSVPVGPGQPV